MDLELATIDDIANELNRRFRGVLLVVTGAADGEIGDEEEGTCLIWRGGAIQALGLAEYAKLRMSIPDRIIAIDSDEDADDDEL